MIGWVLAAQIAVVARGPDTATACQPIELAVAARTAGGTAPHITVPSASDVEILRATFASHTERDAAGRLSTLTEGTLVVATRAIGRVAVPILVDAGPLHGRGTPISIQVRGNLNPSPIVLVRARLDAGAGRRIDSLFVGQQVDYVVDVQLNGAARERLRRNPTFFPPEMPSVLAYDLPVPAPIAREDRHCFEALSYHRALFPLFPGDVAIAPATLAYSLPLSTSFFSREESYELRTDSVRFTAVEAPADGRPSDYAGAVGNVRATATVASTSARMGDPLILTLRLEGTGNVKLLPRPVLTIGWASIALADERVTVDSSAPRVRGTKEFDWLLTPRLAGRRTVPAIRYPFFDPDRADYELSVADSIVVDVASAALASADTLTGTRLSIRTTLRAERPASLPSRPWYWALLLAAPAPAALRRVRIRRRRGDATASPIGRLRALARARTPPPAHALRRAFLDALRARVSVVGEWSAPAELGRTLRRAGVTDATAQAAESLLDRLDVAAFAGAPPTEPAVAGEAVAIATAVDREAVRPVARVPHGAVPALLIAFVVSSSLLALPSGAEHAFHDGVLAYQRSDWTAATQLFGRVAARTPRAVDAWANLGTAAWAASDTAHAVVAWQ
ncbi:MAG TPA: BatD family protein, partial [Gemmatimonadaceae bacterium]